MPELALALWLLYGVLALGVRVELQRRRTGSSGLVGARARPGSLAWFAELGHVVGLGLGLAAPIVDLIGGLDPIAALDHNAVAIVGIAIFALGLGGVVYSQAAMGRSWRIGTDPGERTELVTDGPFARVRNPIYTSLVPTLLGLALIVPNLVALASLPIFAASFIVITRVVEEPQLLRVHGDAYAGYAARVGRFLPGIGKLRL